MVVPLSDRLAHRRTGYRGIRQPPQSLHGSTSFVRACGHRKDLRPRRRIHLVPIVGGQIHQWHLEAIMNDHAENDALPAVVDRATWRAERDTQLAREKAHTREGDAIAAARRRLPMVEVDGTATLIGENGPVTLLEVFEGRRLL